LHIFNVLTCDFSAASIKVLAVILLLKTYQLWSFLPIENISQVSILYEIQWVLLVPKTNINYSKINGR